MPLATTRRTGLVDQVIEQMRQAIVSGGWPVDERIPPEPELVAALGVGRNTIREAVRALSHAGLLDVRQGNGTFVRATSEISGALRRLYGTQLREVVQVRRILEVEGARLAATQRTDAEATELATLLDSRDAAMSDRRWEDATESDTQFHLAVVRCSHNSLLSELHLGLTDVIRASVATALESNLDIEYVHHAALVAAIKDSDPDLAVLESNEILDDMLHRVQLDPDDAETSAGAGR
ncbi:FadR/GntR family transcriptional regulator [Fodinicola feengrottensis]|uniref:FadR/GntR family transcriptional regulator n=1 Tax=Fodinicola feengrottensis TaxID=435914 RepID=UPI0031DF1EEC